MSRSIKKGPYIDEKLMKKVMKQKADNNRVDIKTWARACQIPPEFVGHTFLVHNGKHFIKVLVSENMVGHRLGEFSPTRMFRGHGKVVAREISKT
jgi:small subunit ribosomal protein S19